jgi:hypothetical protein
MKDQERSALRAGKGVRLPVTGGILHKIADALSEAATMYDAAADPAEFMKELELDEESHTSYSRGANHYEADNKYLVIRTGAGEEFRMMFSLTDKGNFTLDFRGWFTPAGMG